MIYRGLITISSLALLCVPSALSHEGSRRGSYDIKGSVGRLSCTTHRTPCRWGQDNPIPLYNGNPTPLMHGGYEKHNKKAGHKNCHRHIIYDTPPNYTVQKWERENAGHGTTCRKT